MRLARGVPFISDMRPSCRDELERRAKRPSDLPNSNSRKARVFGRSDGRFARRSNSSDMLIKHIGNWSPDPIGVSFPNNNDVALQLFGDRADSRLVGNQSTILL